MRRSAQAAIAVVALWSAAAPAVAQTVEEFYKSTPITMLVGSGAGGGYDVYARTFARFWTNHIPGHPNIIAKNMPAAAGLAAASTLYTSAEHDGSIIGAGHLVLCTLGDDHSGDRPEIVALDRGERIG